MNGPDHGRSGQSGGPRILSARSRRELTAEDCGPLMARGYACSQAAALVSGSPPEATLILAPASRAAPSAPTTQAGQGSVRSARTCGQGRSAAITQSAARALVLA